MSALFAVGMEAFHIPLCGALTLCVGGSGLQGAVSGRREGWGGFHFAQELSENREVRPPVQPHWWLSHPLRETAMCFYFRSLQVTIQNKSQCSFISWSLMSPQFRFSSIQKDAAERRDKERNARSWQDSPCAS